MGFHPLRGSNAEDFGVRFPPLSDAYDLALRQKAHQAWEKLRPTDSTRRVHEGVYAFVAGPSYETRAECRMLHELGADVVGMSTVPEIIVARHCGMRILAMSLVTNNAVLQPVARGDDSALHHLTAEEMVAHLSKGMASHAEVLEAGRQAAGDMQVRTPRQSSGEDTNMSDACPTCCVGDVMWLNRQPAHSSLLETGSSLGLECLVEALLATRLRILDLAILLLEPTSLLFSSEDFLHESLLSVLV